MMGFVGMRRDVLRRGAAAIGAATVAGNAGCMGVLGGSDYSDWLPAPHIIDSGDHYGVQGLDLQSLSENEDRLDGWNLADYEDRWAPAAVAWGTVEMALRFSGQLVVEAEFEQSEVVSAYAGADYTETGEHEGYVLLRGPEERRAAAVGGGALVLAGGVSGDVEDPEKAIGAVIDAKKGNVDRYVDDSDHFDELVDRVDEGDFVTGLTHDLVENPSERGFFENQVARGQLWNVEGEQTKGKWALVFDEADDVDVDALEKWAGPTQDESDFEFTKWRDFEVTKNGRAAVIEATADTANL